MRGPLAMFWSRTSSAKVIVATPLGPNQPMNRRVARSVGVPISATQTASGRASRKTTATNASDGQPSRVSALQREQRAEHEEDAELDDLDELVGARSKC